MSSRKVNRAEFLRKSYSLLLEETRNTLIASNKVFLRPPCAVNKKKLVQLCTGCGDCMDACPHKAVAMVTDAGKETPLPAIDPEKVPCQICEDIPCVAACSTGALVTGTNRKIGLARIKKTTCFAHNGQICDYCYDRCPQKNDAITMDGRLPVINNEQCTGCGICVYFCPAPGKGIAVTPGSKG